MTPNEAWAAAYNQLELQLDRASFETWLRGAELVGYEAGIYVVGVANGYARDMLQERLYRNVRRVLSDIAGEHCEIRFEVRRPGEAADREQVDEGEPLFTSPPTPLQPGETEAEEAEPEWAHKLPPEFYFFAKVPEAIIDQLDVTALGVLVKFIRYINRKRNIFIRSLAQLAELFGMAKSTIGRHVQALVDAGCMSVTPGNGRGSANTYRLAGLLAVAICGEDVAARTSREAALGIAPQPKKAAESENKVTQNESTSGEKGSKMSPQDEKVTQNESISGDKVTQNESPIQTFKLLDALKDKDAYAGARARERSVARAVAGEVSDKFNYPRGHFMDKKQKARREPEKILGAWATAFGEPSAYQAAVLRDIEKRYGRVLFDEALVLVQKRWRGNRGLDPLKLLQKKLSAQHRVAVVLESVAKRDVAKVAGS